MELRRRNNVIMILSAVAILVLMLFSTREQQRWAGLVPPAGEPEAATSLISLAIESFLDEEGMLDSLLASGPPGGWYLAPAESALVVNLAGEAGVPADSVRRVYLRVRAGRLGTGT